MDQDLATLQILSDTLKEEPQASQRTLAKKANMSLGMMNAILGRFVERGWIMLTNVNGRKFAYAVTPNGISELTERGKRFALRTFKIANEYNDVLYEVISKAKAEGKSKVVLYGNSYIKFLIRYVCDTLNIEFVEKENIGDVVKDFFNLIGELEADEVQICAKSKGIVSLLDILNFK